MTQESRIKTIAKSMLKQNLRFGSGQIIIGKQVISWQISIKDLKR